MTRAVGRLAEVYQACGGGGALAPSELESTLRRAVDRAIRTWPSFGLAPDAFVAYLAPRATDATRLDSVHVEDLYLACACVHGVASAVAELERRYLADVTSFVAPIDARAGLAEEVRQHVSEKLLVAAPGTAPGLSSYSGRGPLGAFIRVAIVRTTRYLLRGERAEHARRRWIRVGDRARDPELSHLKTRYVREFEEALEKVLADLDADTRTILRMRFVDGMRPLAIAKLFGVDKSTVTRWIARARDEIVHETRRRLADRLGLSPSDVASVIALVQSRVDMSICRHLETKSADRGR